MDDPSRGDLRWHIEQLSRFSGWIGIEIAISQAETRRFLGVRQA